MATILVLGTFYLVCPMIPARPKSVCTAPTDGALLASSVAEVDVRVITAGLLLCLGTVAQELPSAFWESPQVRDGQYVLWHDPGTVETLDFRYGIGGEAMAPKAPFTFVEEDPSGTTPKVRVRDANDRQWVSNSATKPVPTPSAHASRGQSDITPSRIILSRKASSKASSNLQRARKEIDGKGRFEDARFQLRTKDPKFLKDGELVVDR